MIRSPQLKKRAGDLDLKEAYILQLKKDRARANLHQRYDEAEKLNGAIQCFSDFIGCSFGEVLKIIKQKGLD